MSACPFVGLSLCHCFMANLPFISYLLIILCEYVWLAVCSVFCLCVPFTRSVCKCVTVLVFVSLLVCHFYFMARLPLISYLLIVLWLLFGHLLVGRLLMVLSFLLVGLWVYEYWLAKGVVDSVCPPPLLCFCPLLKISSDDPYLKILDFSQLCVAYAHNEKNALSCVKFGVQTQGDFGWRKVTGVSWEPLDDNRGSWRARGRP